MRGNRRTMIQRKLILIYLEKICENKLKQRICSTKICKSLDIPPACEDFVNIESPSSSLSSSSEHFLHEIGLIEVVKHQNEKYGEGIEVEAKK